MHNQRYKGSPPRPGCVSGAAPHSLVVPAARWTHPGPWLLLAPAGQERDVRTGTRTGGWGCSPGRLGRVRGGQCPAGCPGQRSPRPAVGRPSPATPLPRPHNRLLRLKPDTGASCPATALGPRGARREARSGSRLEAAPCRLRHGLAGPFPLPAEARRPTPRALAIRAGELRPPGCRGGAFSCCLLAAPQPAQTGSNRPEPDLLPCSSAFSRRLLLPSPPRPGLLLRRQQTCASLRLPHSPAQPPPLLCACRAATHPQSMCVVSLPRLPNHISIFSTLREVLCFEHLGFFHLERK